MKIPVKERYNAKARRSSVGGSSHKNKRSLRQRDADTYDSNAQLILPGSDEDIKRKQAEQQRKELLQASGQDASAPMSSKKRKRLDAYIASRLKKEERVKIMQSLAQTSAEVDRTALKSAATLGTGRAKTMEERIDTAGQKSNRVSAKRRRRTMNGAAMQIEEDDDDADLDDMEERLKYDDDDDDHDDDDDQDHEANFTPPQDVEDDGEDRGPVGEVEEDPERRARIIAAASIFDKSEHQRSTTAASSPAPLKGSALASALGSALAKDANGNPIMPIMRKRTKKPKKAARVNAAARLEHAHESDSSFDSSESETEHAAASSSGSRLASALSADEARIGPAPKASLSRKNQGKRLALEQAQIFAKAQALDTKGKGKAAPIPSGPGWDQQGSDDEGSAFKSVKFADDLDDEHMDDQVDDGEDASDLSSEEPDTDQDEEAVFFEAMRRRGLLQSQGEVAASSSASASGADYIKDNATRDAMEEQEEDDRSDDDQGHEHGDDDSDENEYGDDDGDDDDDDEDEDDDDDDDDDDDNDGEAEGEEQYRSRRRGIGTTKRSAGFKDWARAAVGISGSASTAPKTESAEGAEAKGADEDDTAYNLEPVGGFKIKVGDIMPKDGVARGPLGRDEENARERSAFAAKHYAELDAAVASHEADNESKAKESSSSKSPGASSAKILTHVEVQRPEQLTVARLRLPVVHEEDNIVRTIMENAVTVICGETGSGKTTQVPQFLYEAAFGSKGSLNPGMIGVTQPRRVAAVSMAQRVASELSLPADRVSHQIRYDATVSPDTAIKFMTDGVLLRELATDFLLTKYSAIMIDEAHERSINTDVLIGVLSRVVRLREKRWLEGAEGARPLRLIIMSATLRVSDFTENTTLFPIAPPVINIDARQHPVTVHFNRKTVQDYITESVNKATKIHARLPPGGILIFLTGQQEITTVCKKLEKRFGRRAIEQKKKDRERVQGRFRYRKDEDEDEDKVEKNLPTGEEITARDGDVEAEEVDLGLERDLAADVDDGAMDDADDPEALDTDDEAGESEARHDDDLPDELKDDSDVPMHILPLYSLLPSEKQMRIFQEPPVDTRLVVVATNVAETSLTIPNIRYVIDCGRSKERKYDLISGVQSYEVSWISKASASQRAGRAGRTGPGHCYRLYSSAVYEDHFSQFSSPEILRTPVDGLVLSMKAMNIDNVANFPFPTPPDRVALKKAEQILTHLGALKAPAVASTSMGQNKRKLNHAQITDLGRTMTLFPVSPRYAKMLAQGQQHGCLAYIVAMVAALSIGDPFIREQLIEEEYGDRRAKSYTNEEQGAAEQQGGDDYDRAFGKMDGDEDLNVELVNTTNAELLDKERRKARRAKYFATMRKFEALGTGLSDTFRLLSVVGAYEYSGGSVSFCDKNFLRPKAMEEIHKLRAQLCSLISSTFPDFSSMLANPKLTPPNETQLKVIRQLIASAYIDQVAVRADLISNESVVSGFTKFADEKTKEMLFKLGTKGGGDRMQSTRGVPYKAMGVGGFAFIHPTSSFYHSTPPSWVVFGEVHKSQSKFSKIDGDDEGEKEGGAGEGTVWLKTLTKINPVWLPSLGKALCTFSKPTPVNAGGGAGELNRLKANVLAMKSGERKVGEEVRDVLVTPTYGVGSENDGMAGGLGWTLPAIKAKQRFVDGRWILNLV
ncbi:related to ECM16 - putative DEAH-box RNA helicase [Melanopsichium pennsylvanicum]|uniref:RNA helicase n=1 Tax=Melanopsichium pennsylvanicum TaxID=63383 RepID=A0AAJ4XPX6_9BASI|nr:related to ECM16 - putative DEAH-box RNA helicase [Melanopsichium pennsylvanicum]